MCETLCGVAAARYTVDMATYSPDALRRGLSPSAWRVIAAVVIAVSAALLLLAVVTMVARSNAARDEALDREQRSYGIMLLTQSTDASLARAEAALGRYVIDGDRRTATIYYDEWRRADSQIRQLARLTNGQPDQALLVRRLGEVYRARDKELATAAAFANVGKGWYAIGMLNRVAQSTTLGDISTILAQITTNERKRLNTRSEATTFSGERANSFATLLSVLGLALVGLAILLGWLAAAAAAHGKTAADLAEAEGDRAARLEEAVAARTRELQGMNAQLRTESEIRIRAEAQLAQAQKMEAVGQLTGGIAHDFNNMLAVVVGGLDLARRKLAQKSPDVGQHLENAMEGADRAAALTRRLLSFARDEPLLPDVVSPAKLVTGMSDLLDRTLGERIEVHVAANGANWPIFVDGHQLENALLNLAVNARDAMDGAGRLDITVADIDIAAADPIGVAPGAYVRISVTDNGSGMSAAVQARAFEPFYTTKPVGKGTGLGLSQIFAFVRQSAGDIRIRSEPGRGTTISLFLPRCTGKAISDRPTIETPTIGSHAEGVSVLLVEDDPRVHASTKAGLTELGYKVRGCTSGAEALTMLARDSVYDLVLTDVMMAGMTGPELVAAIHRDYGHIGVLFVTGYVGESGKTDDFAGYEVLRKPFTIAALGRAVEHALDRRGPSTASQAA